MVNELCFPFYAAQAELTFLNIFYLWQISLCVQPCTAEDILRKKVMSIWKPQKYEILKAFYPYCETKNQQNFSGSTFLLTSCFTDSCSCLTKKRSCNKLKSLISLRVRSKILISSQSQGLSFVQSFWHSLKHLVRIIPQWGSFPSQLTVLQHNKRHNFFLWNLINKRLMTESHMSWL